MLNAPKPTLLTDDEVRAGIAAMVRATNVNRVVRELGLTPDVVTRLVAMLPVRAGSMALAREKLMLRRAAPCLSRSGGPDE